MRGSASKNCHISDLKITNCTHPAGECRTGLWKTQWRMLNFTGKTGFAAGLLNFLHRVFNMWKKSGPSTECIALFCGKLFGPAKRQVPAGAESTAAKNNSAKMGRSAYGCEKFSTKRQKSGNLLANPAGLCYTLPWIIIIKNHRVGCRCKLRGVPWGTCAASFR